MLPKVEGRPCSTSKTDKQTQQKTGSGQASYTSGIGYPQPGSWSIEAGVRVLERVSIATKHGEASDAGFVLLRVTTLLLAACMYIC